MIYNLLAKPNFDDLLNPLAKKEDYEKTAKEYNNKYANKLKKWTTYDFIPIIIIITTPKSMKSIRITVQLNETILSAKEKYYKLKGDNYNYNWLYEGGVLKDKSIFENIDIESMDIIEAQRRFG